MRPQELIAAFDILAEAPEGITRLRELVLHLAVRGKLVPQDPNDEPASVLRERIVDEKKRLAEDGKIRRPKPLPSVSGDETLFEVPEGWVSARLGDLVVVVRGITFSASAKNDQPGDGLVPCLRTTNVQAEIEWGDLIYIPRRYVKHDDQYVQERDIVMSTANSRELVGKVALVGEKPIKASFGAFLAVIRPIEVLPRFLVCVLRCPDAREALIGSATQTTNIANISMGRLNPFVVCLPPLAEQHRIIAKVDELMGLLDRLEAARNTREGTRAALRDAALAVLQDADTPEEVEVAWQRIAERMDDLITDPADVDPLRQTVLQLAVRGRLVPQDPNDEPASVLLERIAMEKTRLIKEGTIRQQRPLSSLTEDKAPFNAHAGWVWCRIAELATKVTDGEHKTPRRTSTGCFLLSARNVRDGWIDLSDVDYVPEDEFVRIRRRCDPDEGDVLLSCSGSVGRVTIVDRDEAYAMVRSAALVKPSRLNVDSAFLAFCLRSPPLQRQIREKSRQSAQANLFIGQIASLMVPLPPLAEQHRIVVKVEELISLLDSLEERLVRKTAAHDAFAAAAVHDLDR